MLPAIKRPELAAFALAAVVVAGAVALSVTGNAIPAWFPILAVGALTGGFGVAPGPAQAASSDVTEAGYSLDYIGQALDAVQTDVTALKRRSVIGPVASPPPAQSGAAAPAPQGDAVPVPTPAPAP